MAVVSITTFRTEPGRFADHRTRSVEALAHIRQLGVRAVSTRALVGADVGTFTTSVSYPDHATYAAHAAQVQEILGDEGEKDFWDEALGPRPVAATQVETSLFTDLDPHREPGPDRPIGVVLATQWRPGPGRLADFHANVAAALPHIERLGGSPRALQSIIGAQPLSVLVTTTFTDLEAYGAYADRIAADEPWQALWAGFMADPSAELIRSGLHVDVERW